MARRFHGITRGWKSSAMSVATGAASGVAAPYIMSSGPQMLQTHWWAMPAALLLVGHFLQRRYPSAGGALMGVAGYWGLSAFQNQPKQAGFIDAGAVTSYNDNIGTDAAPALGTAEAAMLINPATQARGFSEAGDYSEAYGLQS